MTPERRLWLVRHGETEGQSSIRYHGANDVPLSEVGRTQIRALLPLLAGVRPTMVAHSPLVRAAESAQILVDGLRAAGGLISPEVLAPDDRLREISFGACEGMTREEIDAAFPEFWADYEAGRTDAFPDGEPRPVFAERVSGAVAELAAGSWQGDALLVAHRGTVRHAIMNLTGDLEAPISSYAVSLGSLSVLRQTPGGAWEMELHGMTGS